jgi:hypothetical protein
MYSLYFCLTNPLRGGPQIAKLNIFLTRERSEEFVRVFIVKDPLRPLPYRLKPPLKVTWHTQQPMFMVRSGFYRLAGLPDRYSVP